MKKLVLSLAGLLMLLPVGSLALLTTAQPAQAADGFQWDNAFRISNGSDTYVDDNSDNGASSQGITTSDHFDVQNDSDSCTGKDYISEFSSDWSSATLHYWSTPAASTNCTGYTKPISISNPDGKRSAYFNFKSASVINTGNGRREFDYNSGQKEYIEDPGDAADNNGQTCLSYIVLTSSTEKDGSIPASDPNATYYLRADQWSNVNTDSLPADLSNDVWLGGSFNGSINPAGWHGPDSSGCYTTKGYGIYVTDVNLGPSDTNKAVTATPSSDVNSGTPSACANSTGAFAWLICPAITLIQNAVSSAYATFVQPALVIQPYNGDVKLVWQGFQSLANVALIIVFMIAILGGAVGINVDSYTIKKVLPRLLIVTIAIQFSFFISGIIIDISNILGIGIQQTINIILNGSQAAGSNSIDIANTVISSGAGVLGITTGIAAVYFFWDAILALGVAFLLSVITLLVTLVVREIILVMLTILSPVAFVLWVLPNTQRLFRLWYQNFIKAAMVFPIVSLLIGAAYIVQRAGTATQGGFQQILIIAAPTVAFFMVPFAFKMSGGIMSGVANWTSKRRKGATAASNALIDSKVKPTRERMNAERASDKSTRTFLGGRGGKRVQKIGARLSTAAIGGGFGFGDRGEARAKAASGTAFNTAVAREQEILKGAGTGDVELIAIAKGGGSGKGNAAMQIAAGRRIFEKGNTAKMQELLDDHFEGDTSNPTYQAMRAGGDREKIMSTAPHFFGSNVDGTGKQIEGKDNPAQDNIYDILAPEKLDKLDGAGWDKYVANLDRVGNKAVDRLNLAPDRVKTTLRAKLSAARLEQLNAKLTHKI